MRLTGVLPEEGLLLIGKIVAELLRLIRPQKLAQQDVVPPRDVLIEEFPTDGLPAVVLVLHQDVLEAAGREGCVTKAVHQMKAEPLRGKVLCSQKTGGVMTSRKVVAKGLTR